MLCKKRANENAISRGQEATQAWVFASIWEQWDEIKQLLETCKYGWPNLEAKSSQYGLTKNSWWKVMWILSALHPESAAASLQPTSKTRHIDPLPTC